MLGIGFKVSDTPAAARPLRAFLARDYGSDGVLSPAQSQALDAFAQLQRDADLVRAPSAMGRRVLLKYYAQLERMAARFPPHAAGAFTWNDSFCPRKKTSQASLAFELGGVLFNLGALESQLGVQTDRGDGDGLKAACRHFMAAAGAFAHVRDVVAPQWLGGDRAAPDMSSAGLSMLTQLMLAQAQACFYEKAIKDQMKDAIKAKLVHQALEHYAAALELCQAPALAGTIDRMWGVHVLFQVHCMKAATQFWQAKAAKDVALARGVGYGEEIARLQQADQDCADALKVGAQNKLPASLVQSARALHRVVQDALALARKDNASIYLENVPKLADLPAVGKASMVRPLPPTPDELAAELGGVDLFAQFVPSALAARAAAVKDEVGALLAAAADKIASSNDATKQTLHAMGLPAAVEAFEKTSDNGIPPSLWLKIDHVQRGSTSATAAAAMQQQLRANDEASQRAEKSLRVVESRLSAEEIEDNVCRQNYGAARWPRPASASLNDGFRLDIDRYYRLVKEAKESDKVVATKLSENQAQLELLGQSKAQLDAPLPPLQQDNSSCRDEITAVAKLLLQLSALMEEKDQVLTDFGASHDKFNVLPLLTRSADGDAAAVDLALADEKQFFQDHFVAKLDAVCTDEAAVLGELATANAAFEAKKASDHVMLARQAFLQRLGDAVDTYDQLQSHLKEGAKFYEDLAVRIGQLQQTVDDHCAARDLERRELELHVQADDAVRQRNAHDAAVAAQMMRDMQLRDDTNAMQAATQDEAFARQLAGGVPQLFPTTAAAAGAATTASAASSSSSGLYANFSPQQPQQQPSAFDYSRFQQQAQTQTQQGGGGGGGASAPGFPVPPQHPYASYQQTQAASSAPMNNQPPPAYSSIFSSSPSSTPQFGNYYYAQNQQQPQQQPQQYAPPPNQQQPPPQPPPNNFGNGYHQYPGQSYATGQPQQQQYQQQRPPGGSV